jgi:transposase-like protein
MLQPKRQQVQNSTCLNKKWGAKYPYAIRSWWNNWDERISFYDFPVEIRKIIYTTNLIENLNG